MNKLLLATALLAVVAPIARADQDHDREGRHAVPFAMHAAATGFAPPTFVGDHMLLDVFGTGTGGFVGSFTFEAPHDFNLSDGTYVSDAYVRATGGDILHLVTLGHFVNAVDSVGTWTILGGTGRFEEAFGSGTVMNLNFGASIDFTGTIGGVENEGHGHER